MQFFISAADFVNFLLQLFVAVLLRDQTRQQQMHRFGAHRQILLRIVQLQCQRGKPVAKIFAL